MQMNVTFGGPGLVREPSALKPPTGNSPDFTWSRYMLCSFVRLSENFSDDHEPG